MNINILGVQYQIKRDKDTIERLIQEGLDGECDLYEKIIYIKPSWHMLSTEDTLESRTERYKEVLRHEIIHAIFHESDLSQYEDDETLVDFIALQFPKMTDIFNNIVD